MTVDEAGKRAGINKRSATGVSASQGCRNWGVLRIYTCRRQLNARTGKFMPASIALVAAQNKQARTRK